MKLSVSRKFIIGIVIPAIVVGGALFIYSVPPEDTTTTEKEIVAEEIYQLSLIHEDLKTQNELSNIMINDIVSEMLSSSIKYNIPIGLLHAIFRIESEYRFWIDHPKVNITIKGKALQTNAIGLGGVIWEFWEDSLKAYNIAQKKSDLYNYSNNIEASAAILNWIIVSELKQNKKGNLIIERIISRYYGAYDKDYHDKMIRVTSDLWLRRISKEIINLNKKGPVGELIKNG